LPKARAIAIVDRQSGTQTATWPMDIAGGNFPMALYGNHVVAAFRDPAKLGVFAKESGTLIASLDLCGDADDGFVDAKRNRIYVSGGAGFLDVIAIEANAYRPIGRMPTVAGARTSLFVPELDRLMLAVRASTDEPAAIWVYRPTP